jgi:hypothetical protein
MWFLTLLIDEKELDSQLRTLIEIKEVSELN